MWAIVRIDARRGVVKRLQAERVNAGYVLMMEIEKQDAQQHQDGAREGVQEKFDGSIKLPRPSPDADEQVHGNQHGFPEHKEEKEIERHEDAEHARLKDEKPNVIFLNAILDGGPGRQDRDPSKKRGEHDEQERNAIDAQNVARADRGYPVARGALDEFEAGLEALFPEHGDQWDGNQESG